MEDVGDHLRTLAHLWESRPDAPLPPGTAVDTADGLSSIPVGVELVAQPHGGALKSAGKPASHPTKPAAVFAAVWWASGLTYGAPLAKGGTFLLGVVSFTVGLGMLAWVEVGEWRGHRSWL